MVGSGHAARVIVLNPCRVPRIAPSQQIMNLGGRSGQRQCLANRRVSLAVNLIVLQVHLISPVTASDSMRKLRGLRLFGAGLRYPSFFAKSSARRCV